jgi:hypothetical protein
LNQESQPRRLCHIVVILRRVAKSDPTEQAMSELKVLRAAPDHAAAVPDLSRHLSGKHNIVVAKAAQLIGEWKLSSLERGLAQAFDRFMKPGGDKGCTAKTAIARALDQLESREQELFLRGVRHHQPEAAWGPPVDVAAELRGVCATALVRLNYHDVLAELAELLMDTEAAARIAAARALVYRGDPDGAASALLRLKLLAGDREIDVTIECITGLLKLAPVTSLPFVQMHFLEGRFVDEDLEQAALLSIGETRRPEAFDLLRARWDRDPSTESRKSLILAIALTRQPLAIEFLCEQIVEGNRATALAILDAMKMYRGDESSRSKIAAAVAKSGDEELRRAFESTFS